MIKKNKLNRKVLSKKRKMKKINLKIMKPHNKIKLNWKLSRNYIKYLIKKLKPNKHNKSPIWLRKLKIHKIMQSKSGSKWKNIKSATNYYSIRNFPMKFKFSKWKATIMKICKKLWLSTKISIFKKLWKINSCVLLIILYVLHSNNLWILRESPILLLVNMIKKLANQLE